MGVGRKKKEKGRLAAASSRAGPRAQNRLANGRSAALSCCVALALRLVWVGLVVLVHVVYVYSPSNSQLAALAANNSGSADQDQRPAVGGAPTTRRTEEPRPDAKKNVDCWRQAAGNRGQVSSQLVQVVQVKQWPFIISTASAPSCWA
jgi:hypothetical protein